MLEAYSKGIDPYINAAKIITPGHDEKYYWGQRALYKVLLLGKMYGMGVETLAHSAKISIDEAQENSDKLFETLSGVAKYIEEKSNYCINHKGLVSTVLGDILDVSTDPADKWGRLGINQHIQGFSAVALASGFYNIFREAQKKNIYIRPLIVVHDSCINYFPVKQIFEINEFYTIHFTEFLYNQFGIRWEFETEVGSNYYDRALLSNVDRDTIKLSGTGLSIKGVMDKMDKEGLEYEVVSVTGKKNGETFISEEKKVEPILEQNIIRLFYANKQDIGISEDQSEYEVIIKRK